MADFDTFKLGQRVAHITLGDGTVIRTSNECITVKFDGSKNKDCIGEYDRRWFELYPSYLFHRTEGHSNG